MGRIKALKKNLDDQKENTFARSRKRKADEDLPSNRLKLRATKTTWAESVQSTQAFYAEMGIDTISNSSTESYTINEITPDIQQISRVHFGHMPTTSRILKTSQKDNITSSGGKKNVLTPKPKHSTAVRNLSNTLLCDGYVEPSNKIDHFNSMSDEMILSVFRWLPKFMFSKCARVCKRWSRLVQDESLWKRIDLANKTLKAGILGNIVNRGVIILRLAKTEILGPLFMGVTSVLKSPRLSKVQYLDLSMASISKDSLTELFSVCCDLKKLSLENVEINDEICRLIGENKNLEALNLCMCQGITSNGLFPIFSNCSKLEALNLGWTHLHRSSVVYLTLCLPSSVQKLNISGCREDLTDDDIYQLGQTCPDIKELDVSDATVLTCTSVNHFVTWFKQLEYLALSRCYRILPTSMPMLERIQTMLAVDVFGMLRETHLESLKDLMPRIDINKFPFSSVARPTTGFRRTSIWGIKVRENLV